MSDPVADGSRAAALRLQDELGPGVLTDVEAALHSSQPGRVRPDQYVDPISLGALIVSAATLAWNVYTDLKKKTPAPAADTIARTVRVELETGDVGTPEERDRIIEVVVSETVASAEKEQ